MKSNLYFYKLPVNLIDKNFVLESLETYLAGFTPVTKTDFQYLRFNLEQTIKVNMSQDYQLNIASLSKYNYLKVTTKDQSNNVATYYYFIKGAKQVSESTIEFDIVMDVLNTYSFSGTAAPNKYTLSKKSLITREHKDRLSKLEPFYTFRAITSEELYAIQQLDSFGEYQNTSNEYSYLLWGDERIIAKYFNDESISSTTLYLGMTSGSRLFIAPDTFYNNVQRIEITSVGLNRRCSVYNSNTLLGTFDLRVITLNPKTIAFIIPNDEGINFSCEDISDMTQFINIFFNIGSSINVEDNAYKRIVNQYQEGLSTMLFKTSEETLYDEDEGRHWYVMFASSSAIPATETVSSLLYVNPVQVRLYSDNGYSMTASSSHEVILYATSSIIPKYKWSAERLSYNPSTIPNLGEQYVKIAGTTYDFHDYKLFTARRTNNSDLYFAGVSITNRNTNVTTSFTNVESVIFYGINSIHCEDDWNKHSEELYIGSGKNTSTGTCDPFENIDLTDERLIKCFVFPYAPAQFLVGKDSFDSLPDGVILNADNIIELQRQQLPLFNYTKNFGQVNPQQHLILKPVSTIAAGQERAIEFESKLFHSDYYQPKFVYDSFSFSFIYENINVDEYINSSYYKDFYVNYVCSQNVQSKFMFGFPQYVLDRSTQDYDNVLTIERNNEKALFNNAYINYIRSGGYSYDTKKASSQNAVNGITTALSIVGAVASFASSGATGGAGIAAGVGLTVSAAAGIIRGVHTAQEQDRAISQKLNQQVMQGTSVQGSEDIDILTAFSGNKAKIVYYELSDIMKNAMWDLFHYCGYATHEQKIPDVSTRLYFNFVQGNIILKDFTFNEDVAKRIVEKWSQGVTFMHMVDGAYDLDQEYENFETSLL